MTDQFNPDEQAILIAPPIDRQDIEQEREILLLQGKSPSRLILYKRAQSFAEVLFSDALPPQAEPIEWGGPRQPDFDTIEAIITWSQDKSFSIKSQILDFLDEPTDSHLNQVITSLRSSGAIDQLTETKPEGNDSLAQAILRLLKARAHSIEELYNYSRSQHSSKRPEAAVRQILRRYVKLNVIQENNHVYSIR